MWSFSSPECWGLPQARTRCTSTSDCTESLGGNGLMRRGQCVDWRSLSGTSEGFKWCTPTPSWQEKSFERCLITRFMTGTAVLHLLLTPNVKIINRERWKFDRNISLFASESEKNWDARGISRRSLTRSTGGPERVDRDLCRNVLKSFFKTK